MGSAIAAELADPRSSLLVIDKESRPGRGITARNSGVVHAGLYYPPGFLKRRLCIEGRRLLYDFAQSHGVPFRRTGKLIVAQDEAEEAKLLQLVDGASAAGVEDLSMVSGAELSRLEPSVRGRSAVLSAQSGIVDPHRLVDALVLSAEEAGADFLFASELRAVKPVVGGYELEVQGGDGANSTCTTEFLINAAGLNSDRVMAMLDERAPVHQFVRGHYFKIAPEHAPDVSHLIYPVPPADLSGLGVHLTLDLGGGIRLGPDVEWLRDREEDYGVDEDLRESFAAAARPYLPWLEASMLHADMAGIRPKLNVQGQPTEDFYIASSPEHPRVINLCGIESPGLTAALAIAKHCTLPGA